MIKELNHVAVRTGNMEAALHFYVDILGAKVIRDATSREDLFTYSWWTASLKSSRASPVLTIWAFSMSPS